MRHLPIYGYHFIVIYLELAALSIETQGLLKVDKSASQRSYVVDLAKDIGEDTEIVANAISYFIQKELIEVIDDIDSVSLYLPEVFYNMGRSSTEADRIRKYRSEKKYEQKNLIAANRNLLIENREKNADTYGYFKNVKLTDEEYQNLKEKYENYNFLINRLDRYKEMHGKSYKNDYAAIVEFAEKDGKKRD